MKPEQTLIIDTALVKRLIAAQFPQWAALPVTSVSVQGWDNRTFHLGAEMAVRLPSSEAYRQQVLKEQRWLPVLAPSLPLPIPTQLVMGAPSAEYPWNWAVYKWISGDAAGAVAHIDKVLFAEAVASFLVALRQVDSSDGPLPGAHNFYRGGPLTVYDKETRQAIDVLRHRIDPVVATAVWEAALETRWEGRPVWFHGDVSPGNLLVENRRLSAVIDFGTSGTGDPACDLAITWTYFEGISRQAFKDAIKLDTGTWSRGRGWALWKALIVVAQLPGTTSDPAEIARSERVIEDILVEGAAL